LRANKKPARFTGGLSGIPEIGGLLCASPSRREMAVMMMAAVMVTGEHENKG
jgi:hypothetical protein